MKKYCALACCALLAFSLDAQIGSVMSVATQTAQKILSLGINLGTDALPINDGSGRSESWSRFGFQPDVPLGKIGLGFDLLVRFKLYPTPDQILEIYRPDWIPEGNKNFLDIYLPKILYVHYGERGADLFFFKVGSVDDLSLGNGFIINSYANTKFLPVQRISGIDIGIDGKFFDFPFVGIEILTGNLARLDVAGSRLFVRPLAFLQSPILKEVQLGATAILDRSPYLYTDNSTYERIAVYGADLNVPVIGGKIFSLSGFSEIAFEPNNTMGTMIGFGGRLFGLLTYGAQLRFLDSGFIPSYFDSNYDLYRASKADAMRLAPSGQSFMGWFASLGTGLLEDKIVLSAAFDGPFNRVIAAGSAISQSDFPHARIVLKIADGLIGGFFADASYEKYYLGMTSDFFSDLIDPRDAIIGMALNYKTGASVLTLRYDARYEPSRAEFVVTSSLQASMKL